MSQPAAFKFCSKYMAKKKTVKNDKTKEPEERNRLAYQNEDDRAYGLAGMAIALAAVDSLGSVAELDMDAEGPMVSFSHAFYFSTSPSISPKVVWLRSVENFKMTSMMVMANVMSRYYVRLSQALPPDVLGYVRDAMTEEGEISCSLEADEVGQIFNLTMRNCHRIFSNPLLTPRITEFAGTLGRLRRMSALEVADELHRLQLI